MQLEAGGLHVPLSPDEERFGDAGREATIDNGLTC